MRTSNHGVADRERIISVILIRMIPTIRHDTYYR